VSFILDPGGLGYAYLDGRPRNLQAVAVQNKCPEEDCAAGLRHPAYRLKSFWPKAVYEDKHRALSQQG